MRKFVIGDIHGGYIGLIQSESLYLLYPDEMGRNGEYLAKTKENGENN